VVVVVVVVVDGEIGSKSSDKEKGTNKKNGTNRNRMGRQHEYTAGGQAGGRGVKGMRAQGSKEKKNGDHNGCLFFLPCVLPARFPLCLFSFLPSFVRVFLLPSPFLL